MLLSDLKPLQQNPFKSKGDKQIAAIGRSIQEFERMMEIRKIIIDEDFNILGGNKRYFALKALGRIEIPDSWVDRVEGLTEAQKREFIVKDNAHWGSEWDMELLKDWGVDLEDWGVENDWSVSDIDFSDKNKEIDVSEFGDEMQIILKYPENIFHDVRERFSELAETPEQAVLILLNYEQSPV